MLCFDCGVLNSEIMIADLRNTSMRHMRVKTLAPSLVQHTPQASSKRANKENLDENEQRYWRELEVSGLGDLYEDGLSCPVRIWNRTKRSRVLAVMHDKDEEFYRISRCKLQFIATRLLELAVPRCISSICSD